MIGYYIDGVAELAARVSRSNPYLGLLRYAPTLITSLIELPGRPTLTKPELPLPDNQIHAAITTALLDAER